MRRSAVASIRARLPLIRRHGLLLLIVVFVIGVGVWAYRIPLANSEEDILNALLPSADRAFEYGEQHFNGQNPEMYNLDRAEYFFVEARTMDPLLPYVSHELARIAFLRGDFGLALAEINVQIRKEGDKTPNSYYVRGLIEGYMGDYTASVKDYEYFLKFDPHDWAGMNDEAWVLLKAKRYTDALKIIDSGLVDDPSNPWLLNSRATALYELGRYREALLAVQAASAAVASLTPAQWSHAYPGNDPMIASQGVTSFKAAIAQNIHSIEQALPSSTVQSK